MSVTSERKILTEFMKNPKVRKFVYANLRSSLKIINFSDELIDYLISNFPDYKEEYLYDQDGNRVNKTEYFNDGYNQTTYYLGQDFVRIINSTGTFDIKYYYANDKLVAKNDSGTMKYFHGDHLGSTTLITNTNGEEVEYINYLPYGANIEESEEQRLYTGKELDNTNLHYYGARYYDSEQRKFTQPDPIMDPYNPQNLNRYAYTLNNPYKYTDPTGLWTVQVGLSGTGVIKGLGGTIGGGLAIGGGNDGFQLGLYGVRGGGIGKSEGAILSGSFDLTYTGNDNIRDLSGRTLTAGGSGAAGPYGAGGEYNVPVGGRTFLPSDILAKGFGEFLDTTAYTGSYVVGAGAELHAFDIRTGIISLINNKVENADSNTVQEIGNNINSQQTGIQNNNQINIEINPNNENIIVTHD